MPLGAIGIATGLPGVYYLSHGAAEGDSWSGLVAVAAGAVLVLSGPVTLWRNRLLDASRKRRYLHRGATGLTVAVAAPVLFAVLVFPIGFPYVYTHSGRIVEDPKLGVAYETVQFPSGSIDLTGYYVPSKNGANVVVYPGPPRSHEARMLIRHGYGVLLVDPRGQGRSEGDVDRWAGDEDLIASAEYLQQRPGVDPGTIAGIGFSIGGEQLIEAAAKSKAFAAIVSEGAGGVVGGDDELSGTERILAKPTLTVMTGAMMLFQNEHQPPPIEDSIRRVAPRPVFLIYADPGMGGELQLQPKFYAAAGRPKQIWKVPGAGHTGGLEAQPRAYEQRVTTFLDQALLRR
jgi:pimeloyl-ACP methyl ester carboxylesterase